jgi:ATP-dependent Clp protease ATP-binding subunit ClpC
MKNEHLNPNIPDAELSRLMTTAASKRRDYKLKLLTPQLLLHTFLQESKSIAYKILHQLQNQRGFDMDDLVRRVDMMARNAGGQDANFSFTDDFGKNVPLSDEMLIVLDEGLIIAQSRNELKVNSGHALVAMTLQKVTTYAVLQRIGVTTNAVMALLDEVAPNRTAIIHDFVSEAKKGQHTYYQRQELLLDLIGLLSLAQKRHIILVGPEGSGKRTLAYSLAQLLAEGKGPNNLRSLVQMNETALLEKPLDVMRAGLRRASGGVLLVPDIRRFFADRLRQVFPEQVSQDLHKAILGNDQVIIGTATSADYDMLVQNQIIRQHTQRLDVPAASKEDTLVMLVFHKLRLEQEYEIEVKWEALETAVTLANQYIKTIALPAAAVQLADRASALVHMVKMGHVELPRVMADGRLDPEDVMIAASQMTKIPITKLNEDEQGKYANMVEYLHERIIGQEEAVMAVSRAVKTPRTSRRPPTTASPGCCASPTSTATPSSSRMPATSGRWRRAAGPPAG